MKASDENVKCNEVGRESSSMVSDVLLSISGDAIRAILV